MPCAPPARAQGSAPTGGSYSAPAYSGGQSSYRGGYAPTGDGGWGASAVAGSGAQAQCGGPVTTTFTWSGPSPAPQSAVATETSHVSCYADSAQYESYGPPSAACADGLGGVAQISPAYPGPTEESMSGSLSGTRYSGQGGGTVTLTCSPSASASTPAGPSSDASVTYAASLSPVTIDPVGATSDGSGGWAILVGQECSPALIGIPAACTVSNYQWGVSGTTMQSWTVSSDQSHTTEVDGPGPLNNADPEWYWNDPQTTTEKITCTATVTPPAGEGAPFTVTVSQSVAVYLPVWNAKGIGGQMLVDLSEPGEQGTGYWLHAAPDPSNSSEKGGMTWYAFVSPPNTSVQFGAGYLEIVQLITPNDGYTDAQGQEYVDGAQDNTGLDTSWPYGWVELEEPAYTAQPDYESNDNPGINLTGLGAIYGFVVHSFVDYIMYEPPDSPVYVPLGTFSWSTNGTATIPVTNNWADFMNPAGPVNPSGSFVPFTAKNTYPAWIQNSGNGIDFIPVD